MAVAEAPGRALRVTEILTESAAPMQGFIQEVCTTLETETTIERILGRIQAALKQLVAAPEPLLGLNIDRQELRSWKVYVDPVHLYSVSVSHQRAKHSRGVHDHGELGWAVYGLMSGEMTQQLFQRLDDGSSPGRAKLQAQPLVSQHPGDATIVPVGWAHSPRNESDQDAWTIVIRSRDQSTVWRNRYDVEKGLVFRVCSTSE